VAEKLLMTNMALNIIQRLVVVEERLCAMNTVLNSIQRSVARVVARAVVSRVIQVIPKWEDVAAAAHTIVVIGTNKNNIHKKPVIIKTGFFIS
jgi:hypothetical protein